MSQFSEKLRSQTKQIALKTILLTRNFPQNDEGWTIKKQLIRSSTSVASNYRAASRGRSDKEFYSKLCITVEELDESILWLEFVEELKLTAEKEVKSIMLEMKELLAILTASKSTLRRKLYPRETD
jgi:four helix bundle protein